MSIDKLAVDKRSIPFPIAGAAIAQAEIHCKDLVGTKAQQVRQNTLAVWVVNEYLSLMGVSTDISVGDSWHPISTKLGLDTADLMTDSGKLECRSIVGTVDLDQDSWQQKSCAVPAEVWDDRCGYVFVQLDEANQMAEILGFLPLVEQEIVALDQLEVFENLFDHLYALRSVNAAAPSIVKPVVDAAINAAQQVMQGTTVLGRWLQDQIEEGWQSLESLTGLTPAYAFRTRQATVEQSQQSSQITIVRRGKEISFGNWDQASEICQVTLVMGVKSLVGDEGNTIELGLYPVLPQVRLPKGLRVQIVDADETVFLPAETIDTEELLEFEFGGMSGEEFAVVLEWEGFVMREKFVI
jgi:Protein of unknown function (DUF1822)